MAIPGTSIKNVQVVVNGTAAAGGSNVTPSINVFNYQRTGNSLPFTKIAFNTVFQAVVMAPLLAAMNVRYTPNNLSIRVLDDYNDSPLVFAVPGVGVVSSDSLPSTQAVYMLLRSALRGKSYRGSKHFGPASEVDTANDLLVGLGVSRWQAVRDAVFQTLNDSNGNSWVPTVYARTLSNERLLPVASIVAEQVQQVLLDLNVGTMRRRRSKTVR